jgi:pimeloyl-ACP methyl ester carboxylesterase
MKDQVFLAVFAFAMSITSAACRAQSPNAVTVNECGKQTINDYEISYCHEYVPGSESKDVILWFHGLDGSQESWHNDNRRSYMEFKTAPHVISFSFGPRWFLTDVGFMYESRLKVFTQELLPMVPRILGFEPQRKILMGESMGGFNVLRLASELPTEFERMVAFCPAVMEYSPYWTPSHTNAYLAQHPTVDGDLLWKLRLFGIYEFFPPWKWPANNPLDRVEVAGYALPPIFLSDNDHDQYGFNLGTETFLTLLQGHELAAQLFKESGRHCEHTPEMYHAATEFLGM